jgi:hypothetical protein
MAGYWYAISSSTAKCAGHPRKPRGLLVPLGGRRGIKLKSSKGKRVAKASCQNQAVSRWHVIRVYGDSVLRFQRFNNHRYLCWLCHLYYYGDFLSGLYCPLCKFVLCTNCHTLDGKRKSGDEYNISLCLFVACDHRLYFTGHQSQLATAT